MNYRGKYPICKRGNFPLDFMKALRRCPSCKGEYSQNISVETLKVLRMLQNTFWCQYKCMDAGLI